MWISYLRLKNYIGVKNGLHKNEVEIKFNIPVEPRTLQKKFIRINGNPLPGAAVLSFNKAGNKIKILIPVSVVLGSEKDEPFYIDLPEAKSFNHIPLYSSHFDDIHCCSLRG